MQRRTLLRLMGVALATVCMPLPILAGKADPRADGEDLPAIPILMFHKVDDAPRYPEDISTAQLTALLAHLWNMDFCPVNMRDILDGSVDRVVPRGLKPIGITADDAHRSIVFSRETARHEEQRNARSFVDILRDSLRASGHAPRATLFLSRVGDDRYSAKAGGYFGGHLPLAAVLDALAAMPGLEIGYHTCAHKNMRDMDAREVSQVMKEQIQDFAALGVGQRVAPILAYPYGVPPSPQGVDALRSMGFKGGVLAYPGTGEGRYATPPPCLYDRQLVTDPFQIPRVCVGAYTYAVRGAGGPPYLPIDPLDDVAKDVLHALPRFYTSQG